MYGAVHPDRYENLEWYLPIARSIHDWNELELTGEASSYPEKRTNTPLGNHTCQLAT